MVYVQQIEEGKLKDREEYKKKKPVIVNESGLYKGCLSLLQFPKQEGHAPSSYSTPNPTNRGDYHG